MKHTWNIIELKNRQDELFNMLSKNCDEKLTKNILEHIITIDELIEILKPKFININFGKEKFVDKRKYLSVNNFSDFIVLEHKYKVVMESAFKNILNHTCDTYNNRLQHHNIDIETTFELARDFYKNLPGVGDKYLNFFDDVTNPLYHSIYFSKNCSSDEYGCIYPIYYPNYKPYIMIQTTYTLNDFISLIHEIAHAIYMIPNNEVGTHVGYSEFLELEGSWFNYLGIQYLIDNGYSEDAKKILYDLFYTSFFQFTDYYIINTIYNIFIEHQNITIKEINRIIFDERNIEISKSAVKKIARSSIKSDFIYFINYLICTDLEKIYNEDKDKAFELFENIKMTNSEDTINMLRENGITFMDDNFKNYNEKILMYNK